MIKIIISFLIIFYSTDTFCQLDRYKSDYYNDSQINEMPNFVTYRLKGSNFGTPNPSDFIFCLQSMLESCASQEIKLSQIRTQWLESIGIFPEGFPEKGKIYIKLDENGSVDFLNIYNVGTSHDMQKCLLELFNKSQVKPAYKDNQAVKCYLQFMIR